MEKQLKDSVQRCIDARKVELHKLSRDIWSQPELSGEEKYAHDSLVHFFSQEQSWTVEKHYRLPTAFRASWGPGGGGEGQPVLSLAFLCEYDALPAIGHACGHNLIAEVGAAAALGLKAALKQADQTFPVKVRLCVPTPELICCSSSFCLIIAVFSSLHILICNRPIFFFTLISPINYQKHFQV